MTSKQYQEKLKDPRWQEKRLKILQRDGFKCTVRSCTSPKTMPLHVHHKRYFPGDPWNIPDKYLTTLCEAHHKKAHKLKAENAVRNYGRR